METAIRFRVSGRVQGVGFRAFVQRVALEHGLSGWVKNSSDESVEGMAEGDPGLLRDFLNQVRLGNRWSTVVSLDEQPQKFSGDYTSFEIRY